MFRSKLILGYKIHNVKGCDWYKPEPPSLKQWMDLVKEIFVMERMTFSAFITVEEGAAFLWFIFFLDNNGRLVQ